MIDSTSPSRGTSGGAAGSAAGELGWRVLHDADCGFCQWLLALLLRWDRGETRLRPIALQSPRAGELLAGLSEGERMGSWHLISPRGARWSGGEALVKLLPLLPGGRVPSVLLSHAPGLTERGYRWVASHRSGLSRLVPPGTKRRAIGRVERRS